MSNPITLDNLAAAIVNNKNLATQNDVSTLLPDQTSNSNKFLTTDGSNLSWGEVDVLPNQASNAGKFLTTDGISTTWGDAGGASGVNVHGFLSGLSLNGNGENGLDLTFSRHNASNQLVSIPQYQIYDAIYNDGTLTLKQWHNNDKTVGILPSQASNSGKFLTTDGTNVSWGDASGGGDPIPYSQNGNQTSLYVGTLANDSSTNPYNNYTTALGYKAHANVSSGGQWNANFGAQTGHYYNGQFNVFVGYASGGGGSSSSGGSKSGDYNLMIGNEAGNRAAGHRNIFVGAGAGKNQGTADDRFKLGYYSYLLFDGKLPTGSTEGELLINATKLKVNSSIKTQADLGSLEVGQLYVDTSAGNVLKVKMS